MSTQSFDPMEYLEDEFLSTSAESKDYGVQEIGYAHQMGNLSKFFQKDTLSAESEIGLLDRSEGSRWDLFWKGVKDEMKGIPQFAGLGDVEIGKKISQYQDDILHSYAVFQETQDLKKQALGLIKDGLESNPKKDVQGSLTTLRKDLQQKRNPTPTELGGFLDKMKQFLPKQFSQKAEALVERGAAMNAALDRRKQQQENNAQANQPRRPWIPKNTSDGKTIVPVERFVSTAEIENKVMQRKKVGRVGRVGSVSRTSLESDAQSLRASLQAQSSSLAGESSTKTPILTQRTLSSEKAAPLSTSAPTPSPSSEPQAPLPSRPLSNATATKPKGL